MKILSRAEIATVAAIMAALTPVLAAQQSPSRPTPETTIEVVKLSPPIYPPLAAQARITGDVVVHLLIRQDGSVASLEALTGHPILRVAALESAQKSEFECHACSSSGASYSLTYTFDLYPDAGCQEETEARPARSSKCLYFWKCGVRKISAWRYKYRAPSISQSKSHVTLLASGAGCVEP
jgi:TonB family protein